MDYVKVEETYDWNIQECANTHLMLRSVSFKQPRSWNVASCAGREEATVFRVSLRMGQTK
jgi:hypothetical protein